MKVLCLVLLLLQSSVASAQRHSVIPQQSAVDEVCSKLASGALIFTDDSLPDIRWNVHAAITDSAMDLNVQNFEKLLTCITAAFGKPKQVTHGTDPRHRQAMWTRKHGVAVLFLNHEMLGFNCWHVTHSPDSIRNGVGYRLSD